jgi:hypothetical protein
VKAGPAPFALKSPNGARVDGLAGHRTGDDPVLRHDRSSTAICCQAAREVRKQTDKQGRGIIDKYLAKNCDKEKDRRP